jgi:hypothetical protein
MKRGGPLERTPSPEEPSHIARVCLKIEIVYSCCNVTDITTICKMCVKLREEEGFQWPLLLIKHIDAKTCPPVGVKIVSSYFENLMNISLFLTGILRRTIHLAISVLVAV